MLHISSVCRVSMWRVDLSGVIETVTYISTPTVGCIHRKTNFSLYVLNCSAGGIHIIFNNAGINNVLEEGFKNWHGQINVNLGGVAQGVNFFLPSLSAYHHMHIASSGCQLGMKHIRSLTSPDNGVF